MSVSEPYAVGYRKPPLHTRFQKGTSGFKGRKHRKKASLAEQLDELLAETLVVNEGGKSKRMTTGKVFLRLQMKKALSGDRHAAALIFAFMREQSNGSFDVAQASSVDDHLMSELIQMLNQSAETDQDGCA
ncbi:DUF5681 domain-containing protein [Novosphingobium olei]|uniref:DUF5681 domain-containing protein n=1 Tax=Novosphingobium olei TaxID=2728851 RepID=A0A7Y0G8H0_9SPHN|nr:DUF5681 domain-containing protein [Novosphingobium olei]NML92870.1 hypothetical protein [Novosphingobium olei]